MKPGEARVREEASAVDGLSSSGLPGQIDVHPPRMAAHPALVHLSCSVVLFLNLAGLVRALSALHLGHAHSTDFAECTVLRVPR
jgi:hypothetical protein